MIASSFTDPVLGVDIHFEMVPMPAPVPTPIPNPFTGVVFDPMGLAVGMAMGAAMSMVTGAQVLGPVVYWGAFPATNTGTEAKHVPGHILIPPGTAWAPFPKTPKPVIHPGEVPAPGMPVKPENDAVCVFGSKTVSVMGSNAVRLGDIALSCSEPVRLPSSVVLAIPKGPVILIGGPPSLDLMAAFMASLRTRFVSDSLHALLSRMRPSRFRNALNRVVCFFTGHPVDVASGKVVTDAVDAELPGPIPLKIERVYSSAFASREGPLGHGWSHSLDQAVWVERGKAVLLEADGRELEFDTFDFPDHLMKPGHEVWHPIDRLTLRCQTGGRWEVAGADGLVREFAPVPGRADGRAMLQRIRSRARDAAITFEYDRRGHLEWVRDSGGRLLWFVHDDAGRLTALKLPVPEGEGWYLHSKYEHDGDGDLVRVTDALGSSWTFQYAMHLLVKETDRNGLSFHFAYDGLGEDAWCVRTWGDGGIHDHRILYDKKNKVTWVTDSLGHTRTFHMNPVGQVVKVVDPLGGAISYEYDRRTLQKTKETSALGAETTWDYDERGNLKKVVDPCGATLVLETDDQERLSRVVDAMGGEWRWHYDARGRLLGRVDPLGRQTRFEWSDRHLVAIIDPAGRATRLGHDEMGNINLLRTADGSESRWSYDRLGRCRSTTDPRSCTQRRQYDALGRLLRIQEPDGNVRDFAYDPEGNGVHVRDRHRDVRFEFGGLRRLSARIEAGARVQFHYDTEGRLVGVRNARGLVYSFELTATGRVAAEVGFDGRRSSFVLDRSGRAIERRREDGRSTKYSYDKAGRVVAVAHSDGGAQTFKYRPDGGMIEAKNEIATVTFERDLLGRVTRELQGEDWVTTTYDALGSRCEIRSSRGLRQQIVRDVLGQAVNVSASLRGGDAAAQRDLGEEPPVFDAAFSRDPLGFELDRRLPGGVRATWSRDELGRPSRHEVHAGAETLVTKQYHWDVDDRLRTVVDAFQGPVHYEHDQSGALAALTHPGGHADLRVPDATGNLFRSSDRSDRRYGQAGQLLEARGPAGVTAYAYDTSGNLTRATLPDGSTTSHVWDGAGLLKRTIRSDGKAVEFGYDALGRRVWKRFGAEITSWIWDGNVPLHESKAALPSLDEAATGEASTWLFEPESYRPLAKLDRSGSYSILTDAIGSPTAMCDSEGRLAWSATMDAYGDLNGVDGERSACPFRYPGQYEDSETGLYYNRFRYYDPATGIYLTPDPLGLRGGLNLYGYVSDPTRAIDPFGLINPFDIMFSQDSVSHDFTNGDWANRCFTEAVEEARELGRLPDGLELRVMQVNGEWVTLNNRTLLVAQEAGLTHVHPIDAGASGMNQLNRLLDGRSPQWEQPEVRACG